MKHDGPDVILASTSRYRAALLARLLPDFASIAPDVDETGRPGESPQALAARLAQLKAQAVAGAHPRAVVIGGDQVPCRGDSVLRKPGTHARAFAQLRACSGQTVTFFTAVCVVGPGTEHPDSWVDETRIRFRELADDQIERYLLRDQPYDCAGSFKSESLGIALFDSIATNDPTALQGLPLIRLATTLAKHGVMVI
jgi:septum formation protein